MIRAHSTAIEEINRLHGEASRSTQESRAKLDCTVLAAWRAGQLLLVEKKNVRRTMGRGAWSLWLKKNFRGPAATAQRYLRVAESAVDESALRSLSLRQIYLRLGIATEPKSRAQSYRVPPLPAYLRLSGRLMVALQRQRDLRNLASPNRELLQQDLRPLYIKLRTLFEPNTDQVRAVPQARRAIT